MPFVPLLVNLMLIVAAIAAAVALARHGKRAAIASIAIGVATILAGVLTIFRQDLFVAAVPVADALFYANLFPIGVAFFVPPLFRFSKARGERVRLGILGTILLVVSLRETAYHWKPAAISNRTWIDENGVCRQSSIDTCSDASLVTLLRQYGIEITEQEAVDLARTKLGRGTIHLGLYRALRLKTADRPELHATIRKLSVDQLLTRNKPAIMTVGLPRYGNSEEAAAFGAKYEWTPGVLHDVVFLGRAENRPGFVRIGEPDFGIEEWPEEHLRYLFYGFAVMLENGTS